jgi:hypothetical protein
MRSGCLCARGADPPSVLSWLPGRTLPVRPFLASSQHLSSPPEGATLTSQPLRLAPCAPEPTPDEKASAIIESVPSTSVAGKAGILLAGVGASAAAISNEIYVRPLSLFAVDDLRGTCLARTHPACPSSAALLGDRQGGPGRSLLACPSSVVDPSPIPNRSQVVNEETVILVAFLILATGVGRSIAGPWGAWAQGKVDVRPSSASCSYPPPVGRCLL